MCYKSRLSKVEERKSWYILNIWMLTKYIVIGMVIKVDFNTCATWYKGNNWTGLSSCNSFVINFQITGDWPQPPIWRLRHGGDVVIEWEIYRKPWLDAIYWKCSFTLLKSLKNESSHLWIWFYRRIRTSVVVLLNRIFFFKGHQSS